MIPLVVVEGDDAAFARAVAEVERTGARVVSGFGGRGAGVVCAGVVAEATDASDAVLAALEGAGVIAAARADRETIDRLCDDLRRLGIVDHRTADRPVPPELTGDETALLALLREGSSLGEAARRLHLSRRTADRRLAAARAKLGVATTAEALARTAGS
jgi:DNA-binding NarL/FixJ family response regulator